MAGASFRFAGFELDPGNRRLSRDGAPVELNARYLDALVLLAGEQGRLVSKNRFLEEVWRGIPVTDEALTQCIKTLRRQLGDDAANPRFIETVPKHGYRFIAALQAADAPTITTASSAAWRQALSTVLAGAAGGAAAGG
ncbi:MAG TPA: transcriptional regulator, partial [Croceibacterium sp.]|nr:transcriptional regulator [Croceibacterium sp.]